MPVPHVLFLMCFRTAKPKMVTGDNINMDRFILDVFEESESVFFPIQSQKDARAFVKVLHMKGVAYPTLCQEIGEHEPNFTSWRKSLGRAGIGNSVIERINRPLQQLLDECEDDAAAENDNEEDEQEKKARREEQERLHEKEKMARLQPTVNISQEPETQRELRETSTENHIQKPDVGRANSPETVKSPTKSAAKSVQKREQEPDLIRQKRLEEFKRGYGSDENKNETELQDVRRRIDMFEKQGSPILSGRNSVNETRDEDDVGEDTEPESLSSSSQAEPESSPEPEEPKPVDTPENEPADSRETETESKEESSSLSSEEETDIATEVTLVLIPEVFTEASEDKKEEQTASDEDVNGQKSEAEQAAETETAEPETAEPETAEPETAEPETAEPETAEPETAEPDPVLNTSNGHSDHVTKTSSVEKEQNSPENEDSDDSCKNVDENYNSDLDSDNDMKSPMLSAAVKKISSMRANKNWGGFLYVFSDTQANSSTCRVKVGVSAFPHKRLRQAQLFNPDMYQVNIVAVKQRSSALEDVLRELSTYRIAHQKDWFEGPFNDMLTAISTAAAKYPSTRKIIGDTGSDSESAC